MDSAQDSNLAPSFGDLNQSETLSEINQHLVGASNVLKALRLCQKKLVTFIQSKSNF